VTLKTTNGLGRFPVNFVQKTFMKRERLMKHLQKKHRGVGPFTCELCGAIKNNQWIGPFLCELCAKNTHE
jgi:hypothetical protein